MDQARDDAEDFWQQPLMRGANYYSVLARIHVLLRPRAYLEIGTNDGSSLRLASCASIAIDPAFNLHDDVIGTKPACHMFQMPSDDFFAAHDPAAILGRKIDLALLDGMHLYEFLLRDFINAERHCRANSIIALHDCLPPDRHVARRVHGDMSLAGRSAAPADWWAGDVWKAVAILQRYRPDLRITGYTAPPTGLVLVTGLDPDSTVLARNYHDAVNSVRTAGAREHETYMRQLSPEPVSFFDRFEDVAGRYWL